MQVKFIFNVTTYPSTAKDKNKKATEAALTNIKSRNNYAETLSATTFLIFLASAVSLPSGVAIK